jgi:hypothetical protein
MAENNNNDNNPYNDNNSINSNDNDNDNNDCQRGFLGEVLHQITTPLRVIRKINNLEEHLGLDRTALFQDYNNETIQEEAQEEVHQDVSPPQQQQQQQQEVYQSDGSLIILTMPTNSYSFGGFTLNFENEEPDQNTDFAVGVVISKADRPDPGDDKRKLIDSLCKNQYAKYKLPETSMKSVELNACFKAEVSWTQSPVLKQPWINMT